MIIHTMPQRSDEWYAIRVGKFTASDMPTIANGKSDTRKRLYTNIAAERITGQSADNNFVNLHMQRGIELESDARLALAGKLDVDIFEVGFCDCNDGPFNGWLGCSPDGLINDVAGVEIKCKDVGPHLDCLLNGRDTSYDWQIQTALYVTGMQYWVFCSYNPYYGNNSIYCENVYPDKDKFAKIEEGLMLAKDEVMGIMQKIDAIDKA